MDMGLTIVSQTERTADIDTKFMKCKQKNGP